MAWSLLSDGNVIKRQLHCKTVNDIKANKVNPSYPNDEGIYMLALEGGYFLLMHNDNDMGLSESKLPINLAMKKYFPNSPFVGDILLVWTWDDRDCILKIADYELRDVFGQFILKVEEKDVLFIAK